MAKISFGIGGYASKPRQYVGTVTSDSKRVRALQKSLSDLGFWTTMQKMDVDEKTFIEIGEVLIQC